MRTFNFGFCMRIQKLNATATQHLHQIQMQLMHLCTKDIFFLQPNLPIVIKHPWSISQKTTTKKCVCYVDIEEIDQKIEHFAEEELLQDQIKHFILHTKSLECRKIFKKKKIPAESSRYCGVRCFGKILHTFLPQFLYKTRILSLFGILQISRVYYALHLFLKVSRVKQIRHYMKI